MKRILITLALVFALTPIANAATGNAVLVVTGVVESSINVTIESAGGNTIGLGSSGVDTDLGSVSKYGAPPTGFTLARGASDWTLSSNVSVKVVKANLTSSGYTLTAMLLNPPPPGVTWKLNGSTVTDSTETTITSSGDYGTTVTYSWDIVITDASTPGLLDNWVGFTAISN